jgi:MFS transporter, ACS family, pantothenate transporter
MLGVTDSTRLFIVDGIISLPIAISGFFILPDVPEITRAWYLSKEVRTRVQLEARN